MTDIGFIGLGIMGRPMAGHLQAAGHRLFVLEKSAASKDLVAAGATACKSGKEIAEKASVIIVMVPDTPDVESVLFNADGVAEGLSKGKIVVDMSSISPIATKEFANKVNAKGADYLDAPVSGGEVGAKAASLTIMVGGPQSAFDTVKPLFEKMGKNITLIGGNGDGQTTRSPIRSSLHSLLRLSPRVCCSPRKLVPIQLWSGRRSWEDLPRRASSNCTGSA